MEPAVSKALKVIARGILRCLLPNDDRREKSAAKKTEVCQCKPRTTFMYEVDLADHDIDEAFERREANALEEPSSDQ